MNDEWQVQHQQITRLPIQILCLPLKQDPCWRGRKLTIGCWDFLLDGMQRSLKLHLYVKAVCSLGIEVRHKGSAVEIRRALEGFCQHLGLLDTVQAKCSVVLAQAAVADQIPMSIPAHHAIGLHLTM